MSSLDISILFTLIIISVSAVLSTLLILFSLAVLLVLFSLAVLPALVIPAALLALVILAFLLVQFGNYVSWFFGRLRVSSASLGIPYKLIYGISPYACALMIVSYLLNRYLPGSVREADAGAAGREGEVTAQ